MIKPDPNRKSKKKKQVTCHCGALLYPHRMGSHPDCLVVKPWKPDPTNGSVPDLDFPF